ncbi:MAG TPA: hypothetical protein VFU36_12265 [Jatrophihabitans sp.]|nr:hypothetical protein [Jatrophihabitans sp.]
MSIWRGSIRRWLAAAATLPLLVGGLTVVTASPADAITCIHPAWSDKDQTGYGEIAAGFSNIHMYDGPMSSCGVVATLNPGQKLYYHCYYLNASGNTYTHLRIAGTSIEGWVGDNFLNNYGSAYRC